jgi:hypothetical protein
MGASKIFSKFAKLLDRTTVDLPAINTPLADALAAKAASSSLSYVALSGSYDDLIDVPAPSPGVSEVADLTDATTYDFPTLNTPVADALAAKADSADLGTIATFEGDQNLRTTDPATFAGIIMPFPSVADFTDTFSGNVKKCQISSAGVALRSDKMIRWSANTNSSTADSGIGRGSIPASVAIGNSAAGDASGTVQCANLTASGTVEAASYTLGGVAQQSVGTGDSVEFAGFESTASRNYLRNGAYLRFGGGTEIRGGGTASSNYYFRFGYGGGNDTEINLGGVNTANLTASGTVTAGGGSAASPTITVGDSNTGLFKSVSNRIAMSSAGSSIMQWYVLGAYMENNKAFGISTSNWFRIGAGGVELTTTAGGGTLTPLSVSNLTASGTVTQGSNVFSTFGNGWNINNSQGYYLRLTSAGVFSNAGRPLGTVSNPWGVVTCSDLTASGTVQTGSYVVGTLPLTPSTGMRAQVTDSSVAASGNFGATVAAGGANIVPVFYDGTNWIIA